MKSYIGTIQAKYSARGTPSYSVEVFHTELKKHRVIRGSTREYVQSKAFFQASEWDSKWEELKRCWDKKETAQLQTSEAQKELNQLGQILSQALSSTAFSLEVFKDKTPFPEPKPKPLPEPLKPILKDLPKEPIYTPPEFGKPNIFVNFFSWFRRRAIAKHEQAVATYANKFKTIHEAWQRDKFIIDKENVKLKIEYHFLVKAVSDKYDGLLIEWTKKCHEYLNKQKAANDVFDSLQKAYKEMDQEAVIEFCTLVLNASEYPLNFPKNFKLEYIAVTKILLIDYSLPEPTSIPTLKEVKYVQIRQEILENHITLSQQTKLYDDILYQITLRTIYEIFKADTIEAVQAIVFNGWVSTIDRSTGRETNPCVMSVHVKRSEFMEINLANIDHKMCFKALKGIGSSKLRSLVGIAPIMQAQKHDSRFTESYDVADSLNDAYNLATMDWEDFEHLIRELFEKEFSTGGCEVNVTQASRDGGVDAIVFNPDPIHGGKIVIQAKRYTNPVGVSAVRDLYGTVLNEGANKGILVTTSDFGPDSYNFANGKPLTLFNGGNLLQLLEKHGHKARIDLQEFKRPKA